MLRATRMAIGSALIEALGGYRAGQGANRTHGRINRVPQCSGASRSGSARLRCRRVKDAALLTIPVHPLQTQQLAFVLACFLAAVRPPPTCRARQNCGRTQTRPPFRVEFRPLWALGTA